MNQRKKRNAERNNMKEKRDIPTSEQLANELERIRYIESFAKAMFSTFKSLIVVAAVSVLISTIFIPILRVTGTSMAPTLQNDEIVMCVKSSKFKSGDVVAFYYNNKVLLKRVIGVSGDIIDIADDGTVTVNGEKIEEPYVNEFAYGECDIELPYQVPESRVFVMGDHRAVSIDSRSTAVGCIADEYIIGKVKYRLWPWDKKGNIN